MLTFLISNFTVRTQIKQVPAQEVHVVESGTGVPANEAVIYPVVLNAPNANDDVIHEVQSGQTLWQIAIALLVE